jgi:hypothetical protein
MAVQIQLRRGTASQWTSANPILAEGEMGVELDTGKWKFGNGTGTWSILAYGSGAALLDADKGDITVSGTGTVWTIDTGAVTYAKMQAASTTSRLLGASTTSTTIRELSLGTGLSLSGTTLSATGATVADADYGNITVSGTGTVWTIDNGVVTYAKMQAASTNSKILGSSSTSTTIAELTIGTGLSLSGTTLTATGTAVTDGDKGDITVSNTGTTWTIDNQAVTYAKIQNVSATDKLLGRSTAGAGSVEEITCTAAGRALLDDADASAQRTTLGLGTLATQSGTFSGTSSGTNTGDQTITLTSDVTGSGTGSFATTIAAGVVSTSKLGGDITTAGKALLDDADAAAQRTTLGLGTLATQSGTFSGSSSGTNTGDQTISLTGDVTGSGTGSFAATIASDAVTNAKLANVSTATIKGRVSASTGDPEDLTGTQATTLLDVFTSSLKGLAPSSGGGTTNFLRADGTWAAPSGGGGSLSPWATKTTTYTAADGDRLLADTSGGAFTITLPSSPSAGHYIEINDPEETWATNNLTVARNGSNIDSLAENLVCNITAKIGLTYIDATIGWKVDFIAELGGGTSGSKNVWIPAAHFIPRVTNGAGVDSRELTTNNYDELLFDPGTAEYAQALVIMPSNYNNGTITARFYWTGSGATDGSDDVVWGFQGVAIANDDALSVSMGTAVTVTDTVIATNDMMVSAATSAATMAGTPAANKPILVQIYRDAASGSDTYGHDARFLGIELAYTSS